MTRIVTRGFARAALFVLVAAGGPVTAAGFDCAKATRQIDKAICAWDTVGSLDGEMAAAYKAALAAQAGEAAIASVKAGQKAWLVERDSRCAVDNVTPNPDSEEGLSPQEFGQLLCLQAVYPPRILQLLELDAPPLVPVDVKTVPIEPLKAAYPDDWRQPGYQAQLSPDKALMALGVEDGAGYIMQVWLYEPASGRLVVASPRTHEGAAEKPDDISDLNTWFWGDDGRFYVRARRPRGKDGIFGADMEGHAEMRDVPPDVAAKIAAYEVARGPVPQNSDTPEAERPPGFDDDSYYEQEGGGFTAWAQNRGHGSFELLAARKGDEEPRRIASGGWELENFLLDPTGTRLFYNGEEGLLVTDPATSTTRRVKGTRGGPGETRPINMSADGEILVYSASGSCTQDAGEEIDPDMAEDAGGDGSAKRVCLAYLPPVGEPKAVAATVSAKSNTDPADPWVGAWSGSGEGNLTATIRRGAAKPDYLVIDLTTAAEGCSGAVTLYGKPQGRAVSAESYDPNEPAAPVCRMELSLSDGGTLKTEAAGPCTFYHGAACGFGGSLTRAD